jgi:hypothetical protein
MNRAKDASGCNLRDGSAAGEENEEERRDASEDSCFVLMHGIDYLQNIERVAEWP